ncbi:MAG: hypothetical protein NTV11_02670 [Rhodocyclales bacterium]|nr:hypothetical protein [Rhodocyclales bacterium]
MLSRIIANTPVWVWALLLALLWLGFSQARARSAGLTRMLILPVVMTGLSLSGTISSFGLAPMILLAWIAATAIMVRLLSPRPAPAPTRYDRNTDLFHLPGSWMPMALILGIFSIKYVVGATLAMRPELAKSLEFSSTIAALYGALSGAFIARAARLWKLRRQGRAAKGEVQPVAET